MNPIARRPRLPHNFILYLSSFILASCSPTPQPPPINILNAVQLNPPALVQFSEDLTPLKKTPLAFPPDCGLYDLYAPPRGNILAVELSCSFGQTLLLLDPETGALTQAYPQADSHFLAWTSNSKGLFLRVDSTSNPRVVRVNVQTLAVEDIPIYEFTYDLAPQPNGFDFAFTYSHGFGFGSELYLAKDDGRAVHLLAQDQFNYISFARWSPDASQLAFIKIPDSQTPFTVGELWAMNADGTNARKLADADAGHGYAANWSPDGKQLAFVVRENAEDANANQAADALISNIYTVNVSSGEVSQVTQFSDGRAETPHWSPDGKRVFFLRVADGKMELEVADLLTAEVRPLMTEPACCLSWMRK